MNAFAAAAAAIMADRNIASDATMRALGVGAPVAMRVVLSRPDAGDLTYGGEVVRPEPTLSVLIADYPNPARNDTFTIGAEVFTVKAWEADVERLAWTLSVRP